MRRILSKEEIDKRNKRRNAAISIFLLGILVVSSIGFAFMYGSEDGQQEEQNIDGKVQNYGGRYVATWSGQQFSFTSSPESAFNATNISFEKDIGRYFGKPLYVDSRSEAVYIEIYNNMNKYADRVQYGCYDECENVTWVEKNCSDNMIIYRANVENKVYQEDNCIFIEGDMRGVDAFLYREIGIN